MKKLFFLGCLILTIACQGAATTTPSREPISSSQPPTTVPATEISTPGPKYFTEEFNTSLNAWSFFQTGGEANPSASLENGKLRLDISSPQTWYYLVYNPYEYKNITISTKLTGTPSGSMGLICRYSESKGWYEFNVSSDGSYTVLLGKWLAQGIAKYTPIASDTIGQPQAGGLDYEITMTCQDNNLFLYVNEKLLRKLDVTHYALTEGRIGINTSSFTETPMTASFDWVKVSAPSQ
jgi:hypothetical protein